MKYRRELAEDEVYLPVTFSQFEALVNEMLIPINELVAPQAVNGDFMAGVVMAVIHGLDRKTVIMNKQDLFDRSVNLISNQMTSAAVEGIRAKLKAEQKPLVAVPDAELDS